MQLVAWTVADLAGASVPTAEHVGTALFFRQGVPQ
jgi:predicted ATPase with chaperone activity